MTEEQNLVYSKFVEFITGIWEDDIIDFNTRLYEDSLEFEWYIHGWGILTADIHPKDGKLLCTIEFEKRGDRTYTLVKDYVSVYGKWGNSILECITDFMNGEVDQDRVTTEVRMHFASGWVRSEKDKQITA